MIAAVEKAGAAITGTFTGSEATELGIAAIEDCGAATLTTDPSIVPSEDRVAAVDEAEAATVPGPIAAEATGSTDCDTGLTTN